MTFLEPIIAALIGAGITALTLRLNANRTTQFLLKYGPITKRAYDIIDPVLDQNLHRWGGSQVDKAFELAIQAVADGKLTSGEVKALAFHMAKAWLPQKAADKVRRLEQVSTTVPEFVIATQVAKKVNTYYR